jgi:hypothetical protein
VLAQKSPGGGALPRAPANKSTTSAPLAIGAGELEGEAEGVGETEGEAVATTIARTTPAGFSVVKRLSPSGESARPLMRLKTAAAPAPSR